MFRSYREILTLLVKSICTGQQTVIRFWNIKTFNERQQNIPLWRCCVFDMKMSQIRFQRRSLLEFIGAWGSNEIKRWNFNISLFTYLSLINCLKIYPQNKRASRQLVELELIQLGLSISYYSLSFLIFNIVTYDFSSNWSQIQLFYSESYFIKNPHSVFISHESKILINDCKIFLQYDSMGVINTAWLQWTLNEIYYRWVHILLDRLMCGNYC